MKRIALTTAIASLVFAGISGASQAAPIAPFAPAAYPETAQLSPVRYYYRPRYYRPYYRPYYYGPSYSVPYYYYGCSHYYSWSYLRCWW
jgi:hypothetical protein